MSYTEGVRIPGGNNTQTLNAFMRHDKIKLSTVSKVKQRTGQKDNQNASSKKYNRFASEMNRCGIDYPINVNIYQTIIYINLI